MQSVHNVCKQITDQTCQRNKANLHVGHMEAWAALLLRSDSLDWFILHVTLHGPVKLFNMQSLSENLTPCESLLSKQYTVLNSQPPTYGKELTQIQSNRV